MIFRRARLIDEPTAGESDPYAALINAGGGAAGWMPASGQTAPPAPVAGVEPGPDSLAAGETANPDVTMLDPLVLPRDLVRVLFPATQSTTSPDVQTVPDLVGRWNYAGDPGTPATITYAFSGVAPDFSINLVSDPNTYAGYTGGEEASVEAVLAQYSAVCGVTFVHVSDPAAAQMVFRKVDIVPGTAGFAYYPPFSAAGASFTTSYGDVFLDLLYADHPHITRHEVEHALGLTHPFESGYKPVPADFGVTDTTLVSLLSYTPVPKPYYLYAPDGLNVWIESVQNPETPTPLDILALQMIYGANATTNAGDTVYSYEVDPLFYRTIWDAGGTDTIDVSNQVNPCLISLEGGSYSTIGLRDPFAGWAPDIIDFALWFAPADRYYDGSGSLAIAFDTVIENVIGSAAGDRIIGNAAANNLNGGGGNDTVDGGAGSDTLAGGNGDDSLAGGAGNDFLEWSDALRGGTDTLRGGAGDDQYKLASGDVVVEFSGDGTDTIWVDFAGTYTLGANVENLTLWGAAAGVNGRGNALANVIVGNSAGNTLDGADGNDSLVGGAGNDLLDWTSPLRGGMDTMRGGPGDDQFSLTSGDVVIEFAGEGTDTVWVDFAGTYVLGANLENLSLWGVAAGVNGTGNALANVIVGSAAANTLNGGDGNDTLNGGAGNDLLDWTASLRNGIDWLYGRQGDDQFSITPGDVVQEFYGEGTDTVWVDFAGTYILGPTLENLTLWGTATGVNGRGNAVNNVITGNDQANTLDGAAGNDLLAGGGGNDLFDWTATLRGGIDTMQGSAGDDQFNLSAGDVVIENPGEGTDTAWADFNGYVLAPNVENLSLWGGAAIGGTGNGGDNALTGNSSANLLDGSGGNDTINGAAGADTLIGGTGDDTLVYDAADTSVQGGSGTDTYRIAGAGITLNLTLIVNTVHTGIEVIDLTGTGNNTLIVALSDVLALSDTTDTLRIEGNAGDVVNAGAGWADGGVTGGYHTYTQGAASLIVDEDVTRNIVT